MKGHNQCAWLKIGETENCKKSCIGEYCKVHLFRIRRQAKFLFLVGLAVRESRARYISVRPVVGIRFTANISFWRETPGFDLIELWPISIWSEKRSVILRVNPFRERILYGNTHLERGHLPGNPFRERIFTRIPI